MNDVEVTVVNFPRDYKLFVHMSQDSQAPREDPYLYGVLFLVYLFRRVFSYLKSIGSTNVLHFRSPYEFALHLVWLVQGRPLKPTGETACGCTYCSGVSQTVIHNEHNFTRTELHTANASASGAKTGKSKSLTRKKRTSGPIQAKDYTKLNFNNTTLASSD